MAKEIISYNTSEPIIEKSLFDWDKLSSIDANNLDIAETQKSIKAKYADYLKKIMEEKRSDEVISIIDHLESLDYFIGNRCGFWGEKRLPGLMRDDKKIYDWDELKSEEKDQLLSDIPKERLFGKGKDADTFFAEASKDDYNKKTTETNIVLDELGMIVDPLIEKEEKENKTGEESIREAA